MQSIDEQGVDTENGQLLQAIDLKNITLTPEELFQIQRQNLKESLMSSMVAVATKNARTFYGAQLLSEQTDQKLVNEVIEDFRGLGYKVILSEEQVMGGQKVRTLTIDWKDA